MEKSNVFRKLFYYWDILTSCKGLILFILCFTPLTANAVNDASVLSNPILRLKNYSYEDGLSQANVEAIIQDDKGYLWVATQEGLNRFNGKEFVQFLPDKLDALAVKDLLITSLFKDNSGRVWLGGKSGLSYITETGSQFVNFPINPVEEEPLYVKKIIRADNGNLWIQGSSTLWYFNVHDFKAKKIEGYPSGVYSFFQGENESLWLATRKGIFKKHQDKDVFEKVVDYPDVDIDVTDMKIKNNILWTVNSNNVIKLNLDNLTWEKEIFNNNVRPIEIQSILFDENGIWLATMNGLWFEDSECDCWYRYVSDPLVENSLPTSQIRSIFIDKQSQLWIGTFGGGLSVRNSNHQSIKHWLTKRQLSNYSQNLSFVSTDVTDINFDGSGGFLVSTGDQGVFQLSENGVIQKQYTTENTPEFITNDINQVVLDLHHRLWLSAFAEGLQMRTAEGVWQIFRAEDDNPESLGDEYVFEIYEDRTGRIWIGTLAGSQIYQPESNSFFSVTDQYPKETLGVSVRTNVIRQSLNGLYWLGTEGGVIVLDRYLKFHSWFHLSSKENPILSNEINDIAEDAAGNIWIATGMGLNRISEFQGKWKVTSFEKHPLLVTKTLMLVEVDANGLLWVAGNNGLLRFDPSTEKLIVIPTDYGLQGQQFSPSSSLQDKDGNLYFGGVNGLNQLSNIFTPSTEDNVPILLAEVKADGVSVSKTKDNQYLIPAQTKFTRFYFDILDLSSSATYELRIRIPEHSEQWLPWSEQRYFDFFEMPTGNITLEIQSRSKSGSKVLDNKSFNFFVESFYSWYDYLFWILLLIMVLIPIILSRRQFKIWTREKNILISEKLKSGETLNAFKAELSEKKQEIEQLLDDLSTSINQNQLLESQISDLHLIDKQTGLHTKDFIRLSIENATRQLEEFYNKSLLKEDALKLPQLLFLVIKLDGFEALRLEGGQFLLNQIIIQIAAEIKTISASTDELVRWNKDSFLLYSRSENTRKIESKCQKITKIINQSLFGPSETEKLPITCSIGVVRFPFNIHHPNRFDWTLLLEMANSAACHVNELGGDGWMVLSEKKPDLEAREVELIISDFKSALGKKLISVTSSKV